MKVHLDFETRSEADIWACGAWMYSAHHTTTPLCVAFAVDNGPVKLVRLGTNFHPSNSAEDRRQTEWFNELLALASDPKVIFCAHNAFFEQAIWKNICEPWYGASEIPIRRWRCTRAKSLIYGLPPSLEKAAIAARISEMKDKTGRGIMLKVSRPRRALKGEDPSVTYWNEDPQDLELLYRYCAQDVEVERALDNCVPDLSPDEQELWFTDQEINMRGVRVDKPFVERMEQMLTYHNYMLNAELKDLTGGKIERGSEVATMVRYLQERGVDIPNLQAGTVRDLIASGKLGGHEIQVLRYRQELGKTSNAKYTKLKDSADESHIIRDNYMYSRANTGRWGGQGVQLHNLPVNRIGVDIRQAIKDLSMSDYATLKLLYGRSINDVASVCLRGVFLPREGKELNVADFNAIEARVVMWLAREAMGLKEFEDTDAGRNEDIYVMMARRIFGRPDLTKKANPQERDLGKQAILGCGFQMGAEKFQGTCAKFGIHISLEESERIVQLYRNTYPGVKQLWYDMQNAAMWCINNPNMSAPVGYINWYYERQRDILFCRLPSGRFLCYHQPRVVEGKFGPVPSFMTEVKNQWMRKESYGGHLVENATQATARDIMGTAMPRLERQKMPIVIHTHDEIATETDIGSNRINEMIAVMCDVPSWAKGLPIKADGYVTDRYMKL